MAKNYLFIQSRFFCTQCGREGVPIMRKQGQQRENKHLKKLYCLTCKEEVNHAEIRPLGKYTYEDFLNEFRKGVFVNGERVNKEVIENENISYDGGATWLRKNNIY